MVENFQNFFTGNTYGHSNALSYGMAGVCATVAHDLVMNPAEVVKQRMQMAFSPYGGSLECARCIYRSEGMAAFYRSYTTQLTMNVPYQAVHFVVYECMQEVGAVFFYRLVFFFLVLFLVTTVRVCFSGGAREAREAAPPPSPQAGRMPAWWVALQSEINELRTRLRN